MIELMINEYNTTVQSDSDWGPQKNMLLYSRLS